MNIYSDKLIFAVILILGLFSCTTVIDTDSKNAISNAVIVSETSPTTNKVLNGGVEILSIRLTAKNHMLRLRYKVIDEEKARPILNRKNKPYIIIEKNGNRLHVPNTAKLGALRQSTPNPQLNRVYSAMFKNYSYLVKLGDTVTLVIGDYRVENIPVS